MYETFLQTAVLLLPLLWGGIFHGLVMKYQLAPALTRPIDGGQFWRGRRVFGDNKTWRGPLALGFGTGLGQAAVAMIWQNTASFHRVFATERSVFTWFLFGFAVGFLAMLGELPNSFIKRRLGVQPGQGAGGRAALLFYVLDQIDLLILVFPFWAFYGALNVPRAMMIVVLVVVIHQVLSSVGYRLGMRKTPR